MLGNKFVVAFSWEGTLTADVTGEFVLDKPATLMHVSFGCSGDTAITVDIGDAGDLDGIIDGGAVGQGGTPAGFGPANFNGELCDQIAGWHFDAGDLVVKFMVYHASATPDDTCLVLTFYEG